MLRAFSDGDARPLKVRIIGHPHAPSGMGEHCRSIALGFAAAGWDVDLVDVHGHWPPNLRFLDELSKASVHQSPSVGGPVAGTVLAVNCDELEDVARLVGYYLAGASPVVVYPAWELPHLPDSWANLLNRYDVVWASSDYSRRSFASACTVPVETVGLSIRSALPDHFHSRRDLGLPEDSACLLTSLHLASYPSRKNPLGAIQAVQNARRLEHLPAIAAQSVLRIGGAQDRPDEARKLVVAAKSIDPDVVILDQNMSEDMARSLLLSCDALISLHRAEGFGLLIGEAMRLGTPVVATGYSGNMDYCSDQNSWLVDFTLAPVPIGSYPHAEGQYWAEPDTDSATEAVRSILRCDDLVHDRLLGARTTAATQLSHHSLGARMTESLERHHANGR